MNVLFAPTPEILILGVGVVLFLLGLLSSGWAIFRLGRRLAQQNMQLQSLQRDNRSLSAGAAGLGEHIMRVEQQLRRVMERQDQLNLKDPIEQSYSQAIKLVRQGAGVNDLMEACGLVQDEAELLIRVHRDATRQRAARA